MFPITRRIFMTAAAMLAVATGAAHAEALTVGDEAPDFTLPGTDGETTLSTFRGEKNVVLAFFPKAFTGG